MRTAGHPDRSCLSDSEMCCRAGTWQCSERGRGSTWAAGLGPPSRPPWEESASKQWCTLWLLPFGSLTSPNLVSLFLLFPCRSIAFFCYTLPACSCSLPNMCFLLAPPEIKSWLESMLSNSEGAFHFPVRSGPFKHLCLSHFKDGNRRKYLLLCLENIIDVFWLHKPALIENMQTHRVEGG